MDFYARVAKEVFSYVLRDMTSPEGGFYSAEDADSEGVEGSFMSGHPWKSGKSSVKTAERFSAAIMTLPTKEILRVRAFPT